MNVMTIPIKKWLMGISFLLFTCHGALILAETAAPVTVKAYGQTLGGRVVYYYEVVNQSANIIASVWIGHDEQNRNNDTKDAWELKELPIGWDFYQGIPAASVSSPPGWRASIISMEETDSHALEWETIGDDPAANIAPGQTLTGMSVVLAKADDRYVTGHALIIFSDGYPINITVPLELGDTTPPILSVSLTPETLWPPNNKIVAVTALLSVNDDKDPNPQVKLESITANEPLLSTDIANAQFGANDTNFSLNAKRSGQSTQGRIYTINYSATDASGNKAIASAQVTVPHDQRK